MEKDNKKNIAKLWSLKELSKKQNKFIDEKGLDKFEDESEFHNFLSTETDLPIDENGFIDYKKLEEDGEL